MDGTIQNYTLDMAADTKKEPLRVKQYDTNSRQARITLKMGDEPWTIPFGCQIHINVRKTDGTLADATCTRIDEHTVLTPITEQMTAVMGTQLGELYFLGSDGDIKSQSFPVVVYEAVMDQARIESSDDFQSLQGALRQVQISTGQADIATQYATEQGDQARDAAQRAVDAAASIQVAVDAAANAKACESNAKNSELAAAQTQQEVTDYVEAQKAAFVGYSQRESDSKYANALTATMTGEGGVTVEDAWTAPVLGLDVAGKSEQVATTGKNLFDTDTYVAFMLSKNDANNTVNIKLFDGRECLYINGSIVSAETVLFPCSPEQIYTISYDVYVVKTTGTASGNGFAFARENGANLNALPRYTDVGKWTKITATTTTGCLYVFPTYGSKCEQYIDIKSIQLEKGSAVTEYEPYTGGAPSPNPDYPQDIISAGTVSTGKQLLNTDTIVQGMVNADTGELSSSSIAVSSDYIEVRPGSYFLNGDGLKPYLNRVVFYDVEKAYISSDSVYTKNGLIIVPDGAAYIRLRFVSTENLIPADIKALKPMLNAGDTALPWEPYTGGKPSPSAEYPQAVEVTATGANLFDASDIQSTTKNGVTFTNNGDGSITVKGTTTDLAMTSPVNVNLQPGTYFVSGTSGDIHVIARVDSGNTFRFYDAQSFAINESTTAVILYAQVEAGKTVSDTVRPMLNVGDMALSWEQYKGRQTAPITLTEPLRGIGEYRDRIMCRDREWGIERSFAESILNGNDAEGWNIQDSAIEGKKRFTSRMFENVIKRPENNASLSPMVCSYLKVQTPNGGHTMAEGICVNTSGRIILTSDSLATLPIAEFQAWLSAHPITVIYPLATPTWEPLPAATQQALNALTTYAGTTHLTITAGGPPAEVTLEYVQDTQKAIEQHDTANRQYTDNQIAAIVAALPTATQAAIVDNQTTKLLQEV